MDQFLKWLQDDARRSAIHAVRDSAERRLTLSGPPDGYERSRLMDVLEAVVETLSGVAEEETVMKQEPRPKIAPGRKREIKEVVEVFRGVIEREKQQARARILDTYSRRMVAEVAEQELEGAEGTERTRQWAETMFESAEELRKASDRVRVEGRGRVSYVTTDELFERVYDLIPTAPEEVFTMYGAEEYEVRFPDPRHDGVETTWTVGAPGRAEVMDALAVRLGFASAEALWAWTALSEDDVDIEGPGGSDPGTDGSGP
jgi:hypothetical protein